MGNNKKFRGRGFFSRRQLLVDKKFQTPFIATILIALLIVVVLLAFLIIYSLSHQMKGSVLRKIVDLKDTREIIFPVVLKISLLFLLIGGGFALYNLLRYTNKIVGPMVRYKRSLKALGTGDFTVFIKFRDNDKLKELADFLSTAVNKLNKQMKTLKGHFEVINKLIKEKSLKKLNSKEMKLLKNSVGNIESILKKFKTD